MQQKPVARAPRGIWRQRCFLKPPEKFLESAQNAAKASGEGAARQLKPGYCPENAATACGKGAARDLEGGYCLTLLSEATRKVLGKRPDCSKSLRRRRRGAFEARLLPPECSNRLARAPRGIWRQATAYRSFLKPLEKLLESAQTAAKASGEGAAI